MHLTDHCITDLKSLYAVVKIARQAKRSYVTCHVSIYEQLKSSSDHFRDWPKIKNGPARWAKPLTPDDYTVHLDIWPEELDPQ